jgi:hypothetical protein
MQIPTLLLITISGSLYFLIAVVALHFLRRDYHPKINFISDFAVGKYAWLMVSAFIALAIGSSALGFALQQTLDSTGSAKTAVILLHVWSIGILFAGIFPTDLPSSKNTVSGIIHALASFLAFLTFIPAVFLFSNVFSQNMQFLNLYSASFIVAVTITIAFVLFLYTAFFKQNFAGLTQRIFIATILSWHLFISFRFLSDL